MAHPSKFSDAWALKFPLQGLLLCGGGCVERSPGATALTELFIGSEKFRS
jgi:hypothetical protein